MVNGAVPVGLPEHLDLADYLNQVSQEEGLSAELDFRRFHFESMMAWPEKDERVCLYRYEDVLGREGPTFKSMFEFLEMPKFATRAAGYYARRYSAGKKTVKAGHIRNASSGQWRELFSPELKQRFNERYGDLLERYGYPLD